MCFYAVKPLKSLPNMTRMNWVADDIVLEQWSPLFRQMQMGIFTLWLSLGVMICEILSDSVFQQTRDADPMLV